MPQNACIRAVTFDAAGTLIRVAEPVGETYARIAADMGDELSPAALDGAFRAVFPDMPPMAFPGLDESALAGAERAWWQRLVERVVREAGGVTEFEAYFDALFCYYASGAAWRAYPETHDLLSSLRSRGLRVGVISNFDSRLPPVLSELGIARLLDAVIYSTGCGAAKPDEQIFRHALRALDTAPESVLHVGDDIHADYHGASAAGLRAVHLRRREASDQHDVPTVRNLGELDALLEKGL